MSVPGAPTELVAAPTWSGVGLAWRAPEDTGGAAILGYRIEAMTDDTPWAVVVPSTGTAEPAWNLSGLAGGVGYAFRVQALNVAGPGLPSQPSAMVVPLAPVIEATAGRERRLVVVTGTTLGLDDSVRAAGLTAHVCAGPCRGFIARARIVSVDDTGGFTWQRRSNGRFLVYFAAADGTVSAVVEVPARRARVPGARDT